MKVYLIGSLRQARVPQVAAVLRTHGFDAFDDWHAAGPEADDSWQAYEKARGRAYRQALAGAHARHVFSFDRHHLETSDAVVLVLPAGKSAHLELGWALGRGTPGFILLDGDPDRFDVMYQFAADVCESVDELVPHLLQIARDRVRL